MNKSTTLTRININRVFGSDLRGIIRFQNNSVRRIEDKIQKLNERIRSPKWSVTLNKNSESSYSIMLVEKLGVEADIFRAHLQQPVGQTSILYIDENDVEYTLKSWSLSDKIKRDTVTSADIEKHLDKALRKIKTEVSAIAKQYGFDQVEMFESLDGDLSFA